MGAEGWPEEEERKLVEELRRQWIETSAKLREEGKETVGGVELEELGKAFELAFQKKGVGGREWKKKGSRGSGVGSRKRMDRAGLPQLPTPHSLLPILLLPLLPTLDAQLPILRLPTPHSLLPSRLPILPLPTSAKSRPPLGTGPGSSNGARDGSAGR
jgi:hypothetical protein